MPYSTQSLSGLQEPSHDWTIVNSVKLYSPGKGLGKCHSMMVKISTPSSLCQTPAWLGGLVTEGREQKTKFLKSVTLLANYNSSIL